MRSNIRQIFASRTTRLVLVAVGSLVLVAILVVGAFPVGVLRDAAEKRLARAFDAPVAIGALSRDSVFSFTPEITVHDVRIGQPKWAGQGDFVKMDSASARIPIWSVITGDVSLRSLRVSGLDLALVRDENGRGNWSGRGDDPGGNPLRLEQLVIRDGRFSVRDAKRRLTLEGTIAADGRGGLIAQASGTFEDTPARLQVKGAPLTGGDAGADWPFQTRLTSGRLDLSAKGHTKGALDFQDMVVDVTARAPSLKDLDRIIEAGLFGTQAIDLTGTVRHRAGAWFIDRLKGTIGRSRIDAKGSVRKRAGRSLIDATVHAAQLDFDDLADDAGQAAARAERARIGPRVIPDTRIDLSDIGPTDGTIRFTVDRLLVKGGSTFRTLKGTLRLDHRILTVHDLDVGLASGHMTGQVTVDSTGKTPVLSTDLRVEGTSLQTLIGNGDAIQGPLRGVVRIRGKGATVRQAFADAAGRIAFVSRRGSVNKTAAYVLGRDLGGAIGQQLSDGDARTPLRCAIVAFDAKGGVLTPDPMVISTQISGGRGTGRIDLDGERVSLVVNGTTDKKAALELTDPIRISGTLSDPGITVDDDALGKAQSGGGVLRSIGRSIGSALGLRDDDRREAPRRAPADCDALAAAALR